MHLAGAIGQWRRKIARGALFGKLCARYGALFSFRAHFLKMGAPDYSIFLDIFENYVSLSLSQLGFLSINCTMQVGPSGKSGNFTINF